MTAYKWLNFSWKEEDMKRKKLLFFSFLSFSNYNSNYLSFQLIGKTMLWLCLSCKFENKITFRSTGICLLWKPKIVLWIVFKFDINSIEFHVWGAKKQEKKKGKRLLYLLFIAIFKLKVKSEKLKEKKIIFKIKWLDTKKNRNLRQNIYMYI